MNNTIRGTSVPSSSILTNLREAIEVGEILVKVAQTQGGYKETQLIDKKTGYKVIPEHIVPQPQKPVIRPFCVECKEIIDLNQVYTTRQEKGSETILYYHSKCQLLKGTTSTDKNWDGKI